MASLLFTTLSLPIHPSCTKTPSVLSVSSPLLRPTFTDSRLARVAVKPAKTLPVCPVIRAQGSADNLPDAEFYKVEAIIRSSRIPMVSMALLRIGANGATVFDVKGLGSQGLMRVRHAGSAFSYKLLVSGVKMEIVVSKDQVKEVTDTIISHARTGEIGDGKIFVVPISDVIKVRTGAKAVRKMAGRRLCG